MEVAPAAQRDPDPERKQAELEACLAGQRATEALDARLLEHIRVKQAVTLAQGQLQAQRLQRSADEVGAASGRGRSPHLFPPVDNAAVVQTPVPMSWLRLRHLPFCGPVA